MILFQRAESNLTAERIDRRLEGGWFPYGTSWMTCRLWPDEHAVAADTVWLRVRLTERRAPERLRRALRNGLTVAYGAPQFTREHQLLYERFRATRPSWGEPNVRELLLHHQPPGSLLRFTREVSLREASGRLVAFRWYLEGANTVAGITSVYDPSLDGLGTAARFLADQWAWQHGKRWTYPGYVRPGASDDMMYKVVRGQTEWLDATTGAWRAWDLAPPDVEQLDLAETRRQLSRYGTPQEYFPWAVAWFHPDSAELPAPLYVTLEERGRWMRIIVWDYVGRRFRVLYVERHDGGGDAALYVIAPEEDDE